MKNLSKNILCHLRVSTLILTIALIANSAHARPKLTEYSGIDCYGSFIKQNDVHVKVDISNKQLTVSAGKSEPRVFDIEEFQWSPVSIVTRNTHQKKALHNTSDVVGVDRRADIVVKTSQGIFKVEVDVQQNNLWNGLTWGGELISYPYLIVDSIPETNLLARKKYSAVREEIGMDCKLQR